MLFQPRKTVLPLFAEGMITTIYHTRFPDSCKAERRKDFCWQFQTLPVEERERHLRKSSRNLKKLFDNEF
jgi:hypothetical protein